MLNRARRAWRVRTAWEREIVTTAALVVLLAVLLAVSVIAGSEWMPPSTLALPTIVAGFLLNRRRTMLVVGVVASLESVYLSAVVEPRGATFNGVFVVVATALVSLRLVGSREQLGVTGLRGDAMLAELRDRLGQQGEMPMLPAGWHADVEARSAGGAGFAGDFLVSVAAGDMLEFALVDVSGKGLDAGTRALLLSGALGGLLGAVPSEEFLAAANRYLYRQGWTEGFATAIHVSIDLRTGAFRLDSAGHPPAAQFRAGSGEWALAQSAGPALGLFTDATWRPVTGTLRPGDALLVYTDGVIEVPGRDLAMGLDRLLGEANRLVVSSFERGAEKLIDAVARDANDDRAMVLLWRD